MKKIFTHLNVDLDAVLSVWFYLRFVLKGESEIIFVPADWDGSGMTVEDVALDIDAGGMGIKGRQDKEKRVHSCFRFLVEKYAHPKLYYRIKGLTDLVDHSDTYGASREKRPEKNPNLSLFLTLSTTINCLREFHNDNDEIICQRVFEVMDGYLMGEENREISKQETLKNCIPVGRTILVNSKGRFSARRHFFYVPEPRYDAIVYIDGNSIGLLLREEFLANNPELRADHSDIKKVIRAAGEEDQWFSHTSGHMYCRGTRKAPQKTGSLVDPYNIALAFEAIRKKLEKK